MEPKQEQEARRLIRESVRIEWVPRLRKIIRRYASTHGLSWADACDACEMSIVVSSENQKLEGHENGFENAAQAMILAIADLRKRGK